MNQAKTLTLFLHCTGIRKSIWSYLPSCSWIRFQADSAKYLSLQNYVHEEKKPLVLKARMAAVTHYFLIVRSEFPAFDFFKEYLFLSFRRSILPLAQSFLSSVQTSVVWGISQGKWFVVVVFFHILQITVQLLMAAHCLPTGTLPSSPSHKPFVRLILLFTGHFRVPKPHFESEAHCSETFHVNLTSGSIFVSLCK